MAEIAYEGKTAVSAVDVRNSLMTVVSDDLFSATVFLLVVINDITCLRFTDLNCT